MRKAIKCLLCFLIIVVFLGQSSLASSSGPGDCTRKTVHPEMLQFLLNLTGLKTEIVDLNRGGCFEKGLYIEGIRDITLLIGFPKTGIRKGMPFLLSVDDAEMLVELSEEGGLNVIDGNEKIIPSSVGSFVECLIDESADFIDDIGDCGANLLCIVGALVSGLIDILECIAYII